jgi:hypothetical protein
MSRRRADRDVAEPDRLPFLDLDDVLAARAAKGRSQATRSNHWNRRVQ